MILDRRDYLQGARKCGAIARCVHEALTNVPPTVLQESLRQHFTWTNSPEVKCSSVQPGNEANIVLPIVHLQLTAIQLT